MIWSVDVREAAKKRDVSLAKEIEIGEALRLAKQGERVNFHSDTLAEAFQVFQQLANIGIKVGQPAESNGTYIIRCNARSRSGGVGLDEFLAALNS